MLDVHSHETLGTIELPALALANRSDQMRTFGLVALAAPLPENCPSPGAVHVSVAGHTRAFSAGECIQHGPHGRRVVIHLLSHLIPDGRHSIDVELLFSSGEKVGFPSKSIEIENSTDLAASVREDLKSFGAPVILPRLIDSSMFPHDVGRTRAWFDDIQPIDVPLSFDQPADLEAAHRHLERWGFCILPELLPQDLIDAFKAELDAAIDSKRLNYETGSSQRIHNAHHLPSGRKIWLYPAVMRFLQAHFRDTPCACQTLTYVNGSEQSAHQDTIHLTPYPSGYMCGVWIALEDVQPDSGELFVYPGSHRTPRLRTKDLGLDKVETDYSSYVAFDAEVRRLLEEGGYQRQTYLAKAGQILVWHENLIHGGGQRIDRSKTRFSIVSHYFAKGAVGYYDSRGEAASLEVLPGVA